MRFFEISIFAVIIVTGIFLFIRRENRPRIIHFLPLLALLTMVVHLVMEGYRWQMIPVYAAAVLMFLFTLPDFLKAVRNRYPAGGRAWPGRIGAAGIILLLLLSGFMQIAFPLFSLPDPSGPYAVGTTYLYFVDTSREDVFTDDPGDFREISLQVWYPAVEIEDRSTIDYLPYEAGVCLAQSFSLPGYIMTHLERIPTHACLDVNMDTREGPYPVVLFSHSGLMTGCQALAEDLASHGYVFMAVGHQHWNPFTFTDEGEVIPGDPENGYLKLIWNELRAERAENIKSAITRATDHETKRKLQFQLNDVYPVDINDVKMWARDLDFIIECLDTLNQENRYFNQWLDLDNIGVMGFSKGGCAAGQFCVTNERCRAGVNMDGFMYGDIVTTPLEKPFMFMHSTTYIDTAFINDFFYYEARDEAYMMKIDSTRHSNFGDLSLFGGVLKWEGILGPIDGERCVHIQNEYVRAFFDKCLKGKEAPLLDGPSDNFPEVDFRFRRGELVSEKVIPLSN
jgi:predicted dienelactone hydrolase